MTPTIINNQQLLECIKGYIDKESSTKEEVFVSGLTSDFANASFKDVKWHHKSHSCKHWYRVKLFCSDDQGCPGHPSQQTAKS